jgi:hypothetical protein
LARRLPACQTDGKITQAYPSIYFQEDQHMKRRVTVNTRRGPGLVGTMATTAAIAGTAVVTTKVVGGAMGGPSQKQAAAQQDAAQDQQMAELQAQQEQLAAQQEDLAQQQQAAAQQQQAAAQQAAAGPAPDSLDYQAAEIQKLTVMKDQGLITEEEFAAKKRQILGI